MKSRTKAFLLAGGALLVVVAALAAIKATQFGKMKQAHEAARPPPESVTTAEVEETEWPTLLRAVGSVVADRAVTIAPELPGTVVRIGFESGKVVKRGDLLVELDASSERAQLAALVAQAELARISRQRATELREGGAMSQAELDAAVSTAKQAVANVQNLRTVIAKKQIRAPFDGRLGIRSVNLGQVVSPGTPIVQVASYDPIFADFSLPQQALRKLAIDQPVTLSTDAFDQTWQGVVSAIDTQVDPNTRSIKVRARFANSDERLRPGMFVNIEVRLPESKHVLVIAATALIHAPYGDSVFVVEQQPDTQAQLARQRFVRTGESRGDLVSIRSGLEAGETVVTSGGFKLKNDTPITIDNSLAPEAKMSPRPREG